MATEKMNVQQQR